MSRPHLLFITGKLAEPALRRLLAELAPKVGFDATVEVLPITVIALATTAWVARKLTIPAGVDKIILPGLCVGDLDVVREKAGVPVERGPADLRDLPEYFGAGGGPPADYGAFDIEIVAEVNHAPRLSTADLVARALRASAAGADVIDVGCDPGPTWAGVGDAVHALRGAGLRVSVDSFNPDEVAAAVRAGAELVLSVTSASAAAAGDWGCEVVAVPDLPGTLDGLDDTVATLDRLGVRYRLDPILEPIGVGFAASLGRYLEVRRRYPDAEMLMGVGNLTELTDVDSAGVNVLLLGFCQEAGIRSVLTTEVANWCRSCVGELDVARRLVHHAHAGRIPPKRLDPRLVMLRDPKLRTHGDEVLRELAGRVADRNVRLFAERGRLYAISGTMFVEADDPFDLFEQMRARDEFDPSHAFYLGYELSKAATALTLGKNYTQDQALSWGILTVPERSHRAKAREAGG